VAMNIFDLPGRKGERWAPGCIKADIDLPTTELFDSSRFVGSARLRTDGTIEITTSTPGFENAMAIGIGYRVVRSHMEGDIRVLDEIEPLTIGIERKTTDLKSSGG
jgi:hypothetical protein